MTGTPEIQIHRRSHSRGTSLSMEIHHSDGCTELVWYSHGDATAERIAKETSDERSFPIVDDRPAALRP